MMWLSKILWEMAFHLIQQIVLRLKRMVQIYTCSQIIQQTIKQQALTWEIWLQMILV